MALPLLLTYNNVSWDLNNRFSVEPKPLTPTPVLVNIFSEHSNLAVTGILIFLWLIGSVG